MRRLAKSLLLTIAILVAVIAGVSKGVHTLWNHERIAKSISQWISNALAGKGGPAHQAFTFGRIDYDWIPAVRSLFFGPPAHFDAYDVGIWDPEGGEVLFATHATGTLELDHLVWPLLIGFLPGQKDNLQLHLAAVDIDAIRCKVGAISTGQVNLVTAMSKRVPKPPTGGGMVISVDEATVHDGTFALGFTGWLAELPHFKAHVDRLRYSSFPSEQQPERPSFTYRVASIDAPKGTLTLGAFVFPLEHVRTSEFHAEDPARQHLVMKGVAQSLGATITAEGRLMDMYSDHPGVDLVLGVAEGGGLLALLPTGPMLGGDPAGDAHIHGRFSRVLIDGKLAGGEFHIAELTARRVATRYLLDGGKLRLFDMTSELGGGHVGGEVTLDFSALGWQADLHSHGVDPSLLGPLVPPEARPLLAGRVDGKAHAGGSFAHQPERVHVRGVEATFVRRATDALPRHISVTGDLSTSTDHVHFDNLSALAEGVRIKLHGAIDYRRRTVDSAVTVDGTQLQALLDRFHVPASIGGLHVEARATGPLLEPSVDGTLVATDVGRGDRRLPRVDAHLRLLHGQLSATELHGEGFGGEVTGTVVLGLFDGPFTARLLDPRLSLDVQVENVRVNSLANLPALRGDLSGTFALAGTLARPFGHASLSLPSISVYGDPYRDGTFEAAIDYDGIAIQKLALGRTAGGQFSGTGKVGWDGALDVDVTPSNFPLQAIPALRDVPVLLAGLLSGQVHLGGELGHWLPEGTVSARDVRIRGIDFGNGSITMKPEPPEVPYSPSTAPFLLHGDFFEQLGFVVDGKLWLTPNVAGDVSVRFKDVNLNKILPEMKKLAEVEGKATGMAHIAFDLGKGTINTELRLKTLLLTFTSDEEDTLDDEQVVTTAPPPSAADKTAVANGQPAAPAPVALRRRAPDEFRNQEDVIVAWDGKNIDFKQVHLRSRMGELQVSGLLSPTESNATVRGQLELRLLEYFAQKYFAHTHGQAFADVHITGPMTRPRLAGTLDLRDAGVAPRNADRLFKVPEGRIVFEEDGIRLRRLRLQLDKMESHADGFLALKDWVPGAVSFTLYGDVSPTLLSWVFPDHVGEPSGRLAVDLDVGGTFTHPTWNAFLQVYDVYFHEKSLSRDVRLRSGTIALRDMNVAVGCGAVGMVPRTCEPLAARIDDNSDLRLEGNLLLGGALTQAHLESVSMHIDGENLEYGQPGVFTLTVSPHVNLSGSKDRLRLEGDLNLVSGRYYQNFDVNVLTLLAAPRTIESEPPFYRDIPLLENLDLELRAASSGPLRIKDNLADLNVSVPSLEISGTLGEPQFLGTIYLQSGGTFRIPFLRADFISDQGSVVFEQGKRFPSETPSLSVSAGADWTDRYDQTHRILLNVRGTYRVPNLDLSSMDGWDKAKVLIALATGSTPDDLRRAAAGSTNAGTSTGSTNVSDGLMKEVVGSVFSRSIEDPLKAALKFDLVKLELGYDSVFLKLCPINQPAYKVCGSGDVGIVGSTSRYEARAEFKLSEDFSIVGSAEQIRNTVDTAESDLTRGRLQFSFKRPVF